MKGKRGKKESVGLPVKQEMANCQQAPANRLSPEAWCVNWLLAGLLARFACRRLPIPKPGKWPVANMVQVK